LPLNCKLVVGPNFWWADTQKISSYCSIIYRYT